MPTVRARPAEPSPPRGTARRAAGPRGPPHAPVGASAALRWPAVGGPPACRPSPALTGPYIGAAPPAAGSGFKPAVLNTNRRHAVEVGQVTVRARQHEEPAELRVAVAQIEDVDGTARVH